MKTKIRIVIWGIVLLTLSMLCLEVGNRVDEVIKAENTFDLNFNQIVKPPVVVLTGRNSIVQGVDFRNVSVRVESTNAFIVDCMFKWHGVIPYAMPHLFIPESESTNQRSFYISGCNFIDSSDVMRFGRGYPMLYIKSNP